MKTFEVTAFFPKMVPAHRAYHSATATATGFAPAARRGLEDILKRDGVKGHHFGEIHLKIKELGSQKEDNKNGGMGHYP
jgi:hypothetical protein